MRCVKVAIALSLLAPILHHCALAQDVPRGMERLTVTPQRSDVRFTLTPTQNIWTFLLLDSNNGRVWQVQYAVSDSAFTGRLSINEDVLAPRTSAHVGRFTLQETHSIFTFLLLDQDDGRVWQIQWSNDESQRGIVRVLSQTVP
jgi:hypothetical protein